MSHQFHCAVEGKMHELFASFREFRLTEQRMLGHYLRCTTLDETAIRTYLSGGLRTTDAQSHGLATAAGRLSFCERAQPCLDKPGGASEALQHGICDRVESLTL